MDELIKSIAQQAPILGGVLFGCWMMERMIDRYSKAVDNNTKALNEITETVRILMESSDNAAGAISALCAKIELQPGLLRGAMSEALRDYERGVK